MRCVGAVFICLLGAVLSLVGGPSMANDAPIEIMSGGASPKSPHSSIRMESENVRITLERTSYTVDAVFRFFNTSAKTTEWVGFPKSARGSAALSFDGVKDFIRFETWVDGRRVKFSEERARSSRSQPFLKRLLSQPAQQVEDERWMVKQVTFPGHDKTTTR